MGGGASGMANGREGIWKRAFGGCDRLLGVGWVYGVWEWASLGVMGVLLFGDDFVKSGAYTLRASRYDNTSFS